MVNTNLKISLERKNNMGKKFDKLAKTVEKEYEKKGKSKKKSEEIGKAVAGKIAREKGK